MTVLLPSLATAFAAFCVWLTVRIFNHRKKPGVAFWGTAVLVVLLVGYPLSAGPAYWIDRWVAPPKTMDCSKAGCVGNRCAG